MEGKVIKIVDELKLAINKGSEDSIKKNDIFMIFEQGEELFDPDSKESLGFLEIPKLKMKVFNVQNKITLLESIETIIETDRKIKKTITKKSGGHDAYRRIAFVGLGLDDDEVETIIEEEPKERLITITERSIQVGNIARKI